MKLSNEQRLEDELRIVLAEGRLDKYYVPAREYPLGSVPERMTIDGATVTIVVLGNEEFDRYHEATIRGEQYRPGFRLPDERPLSERIIAAREVAAGQNQCCQCKSVGAVTNKYLSKVSQEQAAPDRIGWVCVQCHQHVCINCVLTVPGSMPVEICEDTLCSVKCELLLRVSRGELDLQDLIRMAREAFDGLTPEEQRKHRRDSMVSFVHGNLLLDGRSVSVEVLEKAYDELQQRSADGLEGGISR